MSEINLGLEDLVRKAKSSFHSYAMEIILAQLAVSAPWTKLPIINSFVRLAISKILDVLIDKGELGAFIINTKILTSGQASDYRSAVAAVLTLSDSAPKEQWENLERIANEKFRKLINFKS